MVKFHISRWRYWWGYAVILVLAGLYIWLIDRGADAVAWIAATAAFFFLVLFEILIRSETLELTEHEVIHRMGILSRKVIRAGYQSLSNVAVHQNVPQRILRYGDVMLDTPGTDATEMTLKAFTNPIKIEKIIHDNLHKVHDSHQVHMTHEEHKMSEPKKEEKQ